MLNNQPWLFFNYGVLNSRREGLATGRIKSYQKREHFICFTKMRVFKIRTFIFELNNPLNIISIRSNSR